MSRKENPKSDGRRIHRVEGEIREVVGLYLLRGFRGKLPGHVSVTRVIASHDLRQAKVLITVMASSGIHAVRDVQDSAVQTLQDRVHEIQSEVNEKLRMKNCPRLTFVYDAGIENALKVEGILRDLASTKGDGE